MSYTFAELIDQVQSALGNDTTTYTDAIVTVQLEDAIREASDYESYVMMHSFELESRTGVADEDKVNSLVDDASAQFLSTDVDKEIYNTTDRTWAVVTAFVDTGELTLSKDIFPDGDEGYKMFNKGCRTIKQINLEDVTDYIREDHGVIAVEYKALREPRAFRNWAVEGDILTLDIDFSPPDSATSGADVEVFVWFNKVHRVSQLADLAGTVSGTPAAGATTFTIAAVGSGSDVIAEDTLFTFYLSIVRGTYKVKYDLTLSGGGGDIIFWPGLESAPDNGAIVAFVGSTLNRRLERLVVDLTAARALISEANAQLIQAKADFTAGRILINTINKGGPSTTVANAYISYGRAEEELARGQRSMGETRLAIVLNELRNVKPRTKRRYPTA